MPKIYIVPTFNLVKDVDFEVASYFVFHNKNQSIDLFDTYFGESLQQLTDRYSGNELVRRLHKFKLKDPDCTAIRKTPFGDPSFFLYPTCKADIFLAQSIGFGVVKMLVGNFYGEYMLYELTGDSENHNWMNYQLHEITAIRLVTYLQLTNKKTEDYIELERLLNSNNGEEILDSVFLFHSGWLIQSLKETFQSKKGGNNVIPFRNKK